MSITRHKRRRRPSQIWPLILVPAASVVLAVAIAVGCNSKTHSSAAADDPVHVVATCYALADVARQVGKSHVVADWVIEDGQGMDVDLNQDLRRRLDAADLIIASGYHDTWANDGTDAGRQRHVIRIDLLPSALGQPRNGCPWLEPDGAKELAARLADRLALLRPNSEDEFRQNAMEFCARVDAVVQKRRSALYRLPHPRVLALTDTDAPLAQYFGIELTPVFDDLPHVIGPAERHRIALAAAPVDPADDARHGDESGSDAFRQTYQRTTVGDAPVNASRIAASGLIVDVALPDEARTVLADQLRMPIGRVEVFGSSAKGNPSAHDSYLDMLNYDLDQLVQAIGPECAVNPTTLPSILPRQAVQTSLNTAAPPER